MNAPVHANAINVPSITYQVGKAMKDRNPSITLRLNGAPLQVRISRIAFPFGARENANDSGDKSYTMSAVLKGCDPFCKDKYNGTDDVGKLYNFLYELDEYVIKSAVENSVAWFKKKRTEESVRDTYNNSLRPSKENREGEMIANGKYPPTFRIKVPVYDGRVSASFVDASRNDVYVTPDSLLGVLPKGIEANLVLTPSIYVLAGGMFGVTWRLKAAQIFPMPQLTAAMLFDDESSAPPTKAPESNTDDDAYGGGAILADESSQQAQESVEESKPIMAGAGGPPPASGPVRKRRAVASANLS